MSSAICERSEGESFSQRSITASIRSAQRRSRGGGSSENRAAADALAQEKIIPLANELGLPMPEISEYEVHSILQPKA
jgi:hypothetical protein